MIGRDQTAIVNAERALAEGAQRFMPENLALTVGADGGLGGGLNALVPLLMRNLNDGARPPEPAAVPMHAAPPPPAPVRADGAPARTEPPPVPIVHADPAPAAVAIEAMAVMQPPLSYKLG
jgi:hypothetical protein